MVLRWHGNKSHDYLRIKYKMKHVHKHLSNQVTHGFLTLTHVKRKHGFRVLGDPDRFLCHDKTKFVAFYRSTGPKPETERRGCMERLMLPHDANAK